VPGPHRAHHHDEARLFDQIDVRRRSLSGWDRWKARRGAGDPVVAEIEAVVTGHGLLVDPAPRDRAVAATRALETVYELGGQQLLSNTLLVLTRAYRIARDAYDGALIHGLALVLHHYDLVDELKSTGSSLHSKESPLGKSRPAPPPSARRTAAYSLAWSPRCW